MLAKLRSHLTYANVMATIAVFLALGGGVAWALGINSVKSKHIAPDAAKGVDVDEASLDSAILQSRVGGTCQEGEAIQSVASTGAVTCETALQGEPGTPGAPGAPGQPGAPGADGTSFIWQGPWNEEQEYSPNDVVSHQGSSWIATKGERPCEPGSEECAQWELLAQKGEPGQDGSSDTAQQVLDKLKTVDGATSGLDADRLDSLDSTSFGVKILQNSQPSAECDTGSTYTQCAPVTVTVPAGRSYTASVWSTVTALSLTTNNFVRFCAASSGSCVTPSRADDIFSIPGTNTFGNGASTGETGPLYPGIHTLSTRMLTGGALGADCCAFAVTKVHLRDASLPTLP